MASQNSKMASQFKEKFLIENVDDRIRERIAAFVCLTGEEPTALFGSPEVTGDYKELLVIPFPYRSYKMRFRSEEFAGISVREDDRFSHWYLGIIGNTIFPFLLIGETIFSDK